MIGNVRSKASLNATIAKSSTILGNVSLGMIEIVRHDFPNYEGEYAATPTVEEQILPTKNKSMLDDFVIHEIPYYKTSNPSGGYTAIIGG